MNQSTKKERQYKVEKKISPQTKIVSAGDCLDQILMKKTETPQKDGKNDNN